MIDRLDLDSANRVSSFLNRRKITEAYLLQAGQNYRDWSTRLSCVKALGLPFLLFFIFTSRSCSSSLPIENDSLRQILLPSSIICRSIGRIVDWLFSKDAGFSQGGGIESNASITETSKVVTCIGGHCRIWSRSVRLAIGYRELPERTLLTSNRRGNLTLITLQLIIVLGWPNSVDMIVTTMAATATFYT